MIYSQLRKGAGATDMCGCNKNKDGSKAQFIVQTENGQTKIVNSEQEARALTRISGGSYAKK